MTLRSTRPLCSHFRRFTGLPHHSTLEVIVCIDPFDCSSRPPSSEYCHCLRRSAGSGGYQGLPLQYDFTFATDCADDVCQRLPFAAGNTDPGQLDLSLHSVP